MAKISTRHGTLTFFFPPSVFRIACSYLIKVDKLGTRPTDVLLVADAQVPMRTTRSQRFFGLFYDVYMRRAWKVTRTLHPDLVFFLGDMLKSGRSVESDDE
jgi:hypothetical protein